MKVSIGMALEGWGTMETNDIMLSDMHVVVPYPSKPAGCDCTMCKFLVGAGVGCTPPLVDCLPFCCVLLCLSCTANVIVEGVE